MSQYMMKMALKKIITTKTVTSKHDEQIASEINQWKHFYAKHETLESEGGEADLHKHKNECKKNPGHLNFIPVDAFSLKHLPEGQDNDLYKFIKTIADMTVRVDVEMTSQHRPNFWPGTKSIYPFYNLKGKSVCRTGTGMVNRVVKYIDGKWNDDGGDKGEHKNGYTKCWCNKCNSVDHPSSVWWEFIVYTAAHVVFDKIEASRTSLRVFYDRGDSVADIPKVNVFEISDVNIEDDRCVMTCVTCDKNVGDKLYRSYRHYFNVRVKIWDRYESSRNEHRMTFIVSHPHGCSKQVSIGQWKDITKTDKYKKQFTYTTCTCPGSSGATVFCVGFFDGTLNYDLIHSGSQPGFNISGVGCIL